MNGIGKDFVVVGLLDDETEEVLQELRNADIYNYLMKPVELREMNRIIMPALKNLEILEGDNCHLHINFNGDVKNLTLEITKN